MEWLFNYLSKFWTSLTWGKIGLGVGLFFLSLGVSFLAIGLVIVKVPENYFSSHYERDFLPDSPFFIRWGAVILKNILGVILVIIGIILSLPGVPGQGLLTILIGLIMIDIPGKRPFEARIIKRPAILAAVNNLRAKYNKPPLVLD
jgi:multisubunit Na+/H+ antiporter MnhG subunit